MKLRTKYILFVVIIQLVTLILSFLVFIDHIIYFIASEVLILISVLISWRLYYELLRPLDLLMQGLDAIRERDFNVKFVSTGKYEMDKLIAVYNSMIDQLRLERTKQEQQHFFLEKLIFTSPTGILILDYEEKIHQVNPKALQMLNLTEKEILGQSIFELSHPVLKQIQKILPGESRTVTYNGVNTFKLQKSHFIDRGFPRHFIMIEELTVEILAAEKNAYGKVIRMMAHEVNNTIGAVNSILQSAQVSKDAYGHSFQQPLKDALLVAIERNQNLNQFMRNFADVVRIPEPNKQPIELNKLIYKVAKLMEMKAGHKGIRFLFDLSEPALILLADEQQMEQVLINIVKNAIEAIPDEGNIMFISSNTSEQLIIADNGMDISESVKDQLFSPFFSNKKEGQGIGLTVVREILLNHGFDFSLRTTIPGRTEFMIKF